MKYIFDFDDTLFLTHKLKKRISFCLEKTGISKNIANNYYEFRDRTVPFSLKSFLLSFFLKEKIEHIDSNDVYEDIMSICKNILYQELVEKARNAGKVNCYLVTNGDTDFQLDKIKRSGIADLFSGIHITNGSKKDIVEKICAENKEEKILFYDNKIEFFADIDMSKCPNLETVLYKI